MRTHKVLTIAKRDYIATVRTKAFIFGLVVAPVLFGGGSIGMSFLTGKPDLKDRHVAIADHTGVVGEAVVSAAREKNGRELFDKKTHRQLLPRYTFEIDAAAAANTGAKANGELLALSDRVRRKELVAFLEIGKDVLHPPKPAEDSDEGTTKKTDPNASVSYYTNAGGIDEIRMWLNGPINDGIRMARLAELGIDVKRNKDLTASIPIEGLSLVERDVKTGEVHEARKRSELEGFLVPFGLAMILAMIVMVGSAPMLQNVTQDKSQRIVETLLGAASPFELMTGKVLGSVGVSVTSSLLYVIAGAVAVNVMGVAGLLPLSIIPWFYIYLLADVVMLCSFAAALGACCSTPQDAQNLAVVLLLPCILPMFMLVTVLRQPNGTIATVMSLIPPFTPILMLLRQAMPNGVPAWQPWVGLVCVLAFAIGTVWAASRIFRVAILMQGKPPQLAEMLRWAMKG
jgi:ABC-2 type transport system permease protein